MKKTLLRISAITTIGLVMASCNNEEANNKAIEADNAAVQTLVDEKTTALDAEVAAAYDAKVLSAAQVVVDSIANAKPVKAAAKPKAKPAAKPAAAAPAAPVKPTGFKGSTDNANTTNPGFKGSTDKAKEEAPKKGFKGSADPK
jgi:hypothetical protein